MLVKALKFVRTYMNQTKASFKLILVSYDLIKYFTNKEVVSFVRKTVQQNRNVKE